MSLARKSLALIMFTLVTACGPDEVIPPPIAQEITRDHIGYYCGMIVADHLGPKGQIHLAGREQAIWFTSVRDTITFTLLPEEPRNIRAIYVNDMGRADWNFPEAGTWIDAKTAWYVIASTKVGGMGAPEAVPFAEQAQADAFAAQHGGEVVGFSDIPAEYITAPVNTAPNHTKS